MPRLPAALAAIALLLPSLASAHHGQDYLLLSSPGIPHPGDTYLLLGGQAALDGDADEVGAFEPSLLFGASERVAFELHAHVEKLRGEDWNVEAVAPAIHLLLSDPDKHHGLRVGLSAEYEFAADSGAADNAELRLSLENTLPGGSWAANLIASREQGGAIDTGLGLGFRHPVRRGLSLGVEGQASLQHADGAQLLVGAYFEKAQARAIKLGLGAERGEDGAWQPVAHAQVVLHIH
jgi:hypothetical protein